MTSNREASHRHTDPTIGGNTRTAARPDSKSQSPMSIRTLV
jgi:hypothetical protein